MADDSSINELSDGDLARRIIEMPEKKTRQEEVELCARLVRRLRLYSLRHLRNEDTAADLVQHVMLLTLQKLRAGEVREPDRIGSFVLGVARIHLQERSRQQGNSFQLDGIDQLPAPMATPTDPLAMEHMVRCLDQLGERERSVLVLTYFAEQSSAEIADTLGLSPGNVRVIRHRAMAELRRSMGIEESAL